MRWPLDLNLSSKNCMVWPIVIRVDVLVKYKGNIKDWAQTGLESKSKQVAQTPSTATLSVLLSLSQLSPTASGNALYTPEDWGRKSSSQIRWCHQKWTTAALRFRSGTTLRDTAGGKIFLVGGTLGGACGCPLRREGLRGGQKREGTLLLSSCCVWLDGQERNRTGKLGTRSLGLNLIMA